MLSPPLPTADLHCILHFVFPMLDSPTTMYAWSLAGNGLLKWGRGSPGAWQLGRWRRAVELEVDHGREARQVKEDGRKFSHAVQDGWKGKRWERKADWVEEVCVVCFCPKQDCQNCCHLTSTAMWWLVYQALHLATEILVPVWGTTYKLTASMAQKTCFRAPPSISTTDKFSASANLLGAERLIGTQISPCSPWEFLIWQCGPFPRQIVQSCTIALRLYNIKQTCMCACRL